MIKWYLYFRALVLLSLTTLPTVALADTGEVIYQKVCASCHGVSAEGNAKLHSPALAGQSSNYLLRQLEHFSSGVRGTSSADTFGSQMAAMASLLKNDDSRVSVAAYLNQLPKTFADASLGKIEGDVDNGYKYYQASCGSCHGGNAQGNTALSAPSLTGLSAEYLLRQHGNFVAGLRGGKRDSRYGRQMAMMAKTIRDEKHVNDIIAYITSIKP